MIFFPKPPKKKMDPPLINMSGFSPCCRCNYHIQHTSAPVMYISSPICTRPSGQLIIYFVFLFVNSRPSSHIHSHPPSLPHSFMHSFFSTTMITPQHLKYSTKPASYFIVLHPDKPALTHLYLITHVYINKHLHTCTSSPHVYINKHLHTCTSSPMYI